MLDGNVLLRQKRDEVPEGTLSCPDRNLAVFHHYRHYEGLRLLPSVCDSKLIQQTQIKPPIRIIAMKLIAEVKNCKANNDTIVSMISNAVINHHFGVVDFKGAQKDAIIKYYILYLESP